MCMSLNTPPCIHLLAQGTNFDDGTLRLGRFDEAVQVVDPPLLPLLCVVHCGLLLVTVF
jgi:hypothetical protein